MGGDEESAGARPIVPHDRAIPYLSHAEECRRQAGKCRLPDEQATWLKMAADWLRLAEAAEAERGRARPTKTET